MRNDNVIQLKKVKQIEPGDYILVPQQSTGVLLAMKVVKNEVVDCNWVEIQTGMDTGVRTPMSATDRKRLHIILAEDLVVVAI